MPRFPVQSQVQETGGYVFRGKRATTVSSVKFIGARVWVWFFSLPICSNFPYKLMLSTHRAKMLLRPHKHISGSGRVMKKIINKQSFTEVFPEIKWINIPAF
jgi:hypothetical protein